MARARLIVPFIPSGSDFALALRFFERIGFTTQWEAPGYAGLQWDDAHLILQDFDNRTFAGNLMLVLEVDDLEAYAAALQAMDLPSHFPGAQVKAPTDYPWGRELHLIDPAGVCWHVRQSGR